MLASSARRRLPITAGAVLMATLLAALTACGSNVPKGTGALGTPSAASTPPATPGGPTTPGSTSTHTTTAAYPSDYAKAILDAWGAGNATRLTQLTSTTDSNHLLHDIGTVSQHWTFIAAEGAMGSTYATYYNTGGDEITIRITNEALSAHQYHAGHIQSFDRMMFPTDPTAYVKAFVNGWINGNKERMILLATSGVTSHFMAMTKPDSQFQVLDVPGSGAAGHIELEIKESSVSLDVNVIVATPLLGGQHAIAGCDPTCG